MRAGGMLADRSHDSEREPRISPGIADLCLADQGLQEDRSELSPPAHRKCFLKVVMGTNPFIHGEQQIAHVV